MIEASSRLAAARGWLRRIKVGWQGARRRDVSSKAFWNTSSNAAILQITTNKWQERLQFHDNGTTTSCLRTWSPLLGTNVVKGNLDFFLYSLSNRLTWIEQISIRNQQRIQTDNKFHIIRIPYNLILRSKYERCKNESLMFTNTYAWNSLSVVIR